MKITLPCLIVTCLWVRMVLSQLGGIVNTFQDLTNNYQNPNGGQDLIYSYYFKCNYGIEDYKQLSLLIWPSCFARKWDDKVANAGDKPFIDTQMPTLAVMDKCCSEDNNNGKSPQCPGCYAFSKDVGKKCGVAYHITINGQEVKDRNYNQISWDWCHACIQVDCVTTCNNGEVWCYV